MITLIIKIMILMIRVITHLALIETSTEQTDVGEMDRASIRSGDRRKSGFFSTDLAIQFCHKKVGGSKYEVPQLFHLSIFVIN